MSSLSSASLAQIEASAGQQSWRVCRVQVFDLSEGKVIVKGQRPKRGPWRYRVLRWIGQLLRMPMIQPVPMLGGSQAQAIEVKRLESMAQSGMPVPQVLHVAKDYFVMRYLGHTDLAVQLRLQGFGAFALWRQAAMHLIQVHEAKQYLSQGFARNMVIGKSSEDFFVAGLIDFEDDPSSVMSLLDAQVRDWMLFLLSSVHGLNAPEQVIQLALTELLERETPAVRHALLEQSKRIAWLRHLPSSRKIWGRDLVGVQAASQAMYQQLKSRQLIS